MSAKPQLQTLIETQKIQTKKNASLSNQKHHRYQSNLGYASNLNENEEKLYYRKPFKKQRPQWNQSSSTWRHSSREYKFSKAKRFFDSNSSNLDILELEIPSTKTTIMCTLGKGQKQPISLVTYRNAKEKPSPDRYMVEKFFENSRSSKNGKTLGKGWEISQKKYQAHRKDAHSPHFTIDHPSFVYNVNKEKSIENQHRGVLIKGRVKMFSQKIPLFYDHVPGPQYLPKDRHLYNEIGIHKTRKSFTSGGRRDLSKPLNKNPGPHYNIKRFAQTPETYKSYEL